VNRKLRVLNIEDSNRDAALLQRHIAKAGYELVFERVDTADAMRRMLQCREWDLIIADYSVPSFGALEAIRVLKDLDMDIPFIVISGSVEDDVAVRAMLAGAHDYLMKDNLTRLVPAIEREIDEAKNRRARKQAEAAMRESEERYRLLFESIPLPAYVVDQETLRFHAVNEAMVRHYGYTRAQLMSMTILDIRAKGETQPAERERDWTGSLYKTNWRHQKADGTLIDVEITDHSLIFAGRPAYLVLAHDVTDQKMLETQLRQAQKMEAVGQLAGGVAHDFNNLLTVITGYTQLAMSRIDEEHPLHQDFEQVLKAAFRAAALTRQLLTFSRKQILQPVVLDLNAVVSELEKMLRRLIGEDVLLKTALSPGLGHIEADAGQIEQVIMNLAVNARDAMPHGGKLTIETANIFLGEDYARRHIGVKAGAYVMLAVSDTGVGMDANTQARMFEPFFTTKEPGKGTGLGLSTVYGIVKQSGGSIWVYSEVGQGTTFKAYFPLTSKDSHGYTLSSDGDAVLNGSETLLLVEDDEMVRTLTRQVLETYGYRVLEASCGGAAIDVCQRHKKRIDLLITDVVMPEMSGRDLVTRVSELRPGMKVLFMSGYTDAAVVHHGVLDPKTPFLQKPFAPEALARNVRRLLDQAEL